jgi:hypothetical protein
LIDAEILGPPIVIKGTVFQYRDVMYNFGQMAFKIMRKLDLKPCDSYILSSMMGFIKRSNVTLDGTIACNDSQSEMTEKEDHLEGVGIRSIILN